MKLLECQGKELFKNYGIPIPDGYVISDVPQLKLNFEKEVVLKAQVLVGERGKAGGIKIVDSKNIVNVAKDLFGKNINGEIVKLILVEEKLNIEKEFYLSITINRSDKCLTLIFSESGGVDIEETALNSPDKVFKFNFYDFKEIKSEISKKITYKEIILIAENLYRLMKEKDCELVEINPLVLSKSKFIAADSKVIIDDNSLFRHPEFKKEHVLTEIEQKAASFDIQYVELDGDIAIIGNGAGLVMATLDVLSHFKGRPANFLDIGGGASVEKMEKSLDIVLLKKPRSIFINIFGGITRCDNIAQGLVNFVNKNKLNVPMVVRMIGTNEKEAKKILKENNIETFDSLEDCAKTAVLLAKR